MATGRGTFFKPAATSAPAPKNSLRTAHFLYTAGTIGFQGLIMQWMNKNVIKNQTRHLTHEEPTDNTPKP